MTEVNDRLRAALDADDAAFLRELEGGRGLFQQFGDAMNGPMRFWSRVVFGLTFVTTGLGVWTVVELFQAETVRAQILWLFFAWAAWTAQIALKQWLFDRMNTLSVLRDLKKIELRLSALEAGLR